MEKNFFVEEKKTENKKEENIWRRVISFFAEEKETEKDMDFFLEEKKNCK